MSRYYAHYTLRNDKDDLSDYPYCLNNQITSDPYESESVKKYDRMVHQTLSEIFHERCGLSSDRIKELLCATDQNSIIKLILKKKPELSEIFPKESNKFPLLWIAVLGYYQNSAELLVRSGANVNERCKSQLDRLTDKNMTILQLLLRMWPSSWNERFIGLVISHDANLRARDSCQKTALHYAVYQRRVQAIELLLENKADVNAVDNNRRTPLLTAAGLAEADELLPLLMKHGADVTCTDVNGENALHKLANAPKERVDLARALIKKGTSLINDRAYTCQDQPINVAVYAGNNKFVELFLDHGANVNSRAAGGEFPLYLAAIIRKDPEVLMTLLKRGANIDQRTITGRTALHRACQHVRMACPANLKLLLTLGADMFAEDYCGNTPLALVDPVDMENLSISPMLRSLALKRATCLPPEIELKDERMIERDYPKAWIYYRGCIEEVERAKLTKLINTCTVFELLTKCPCEIGALMRNPEFEIQFQRYDRDNAFPAYAEDLIEAFKCAQYYYRSMLQQEDEIDEVFYDILPHMVTRKVAGYALGCEICEVKEIVQASRRSAG